MNENYSGRPRGEGIRCPAVVPSLSFFALACMLVVSSVTASQHPRLCVSPFEIRAGDRGLLLPPPGDPGYGVLPGKDYLIQVDDGPRTVVGKGVAAELAVDSRKKRHLLRVHRDGKVVHSFRLDPFVGAKVKCVVFHPLYETWSLIQVDKMADCGCK